MGWGSAINSQNLSLAGGSLCPICQKSTLCLNGSVAVIGHKIVSCRGCDAKICAVCKTKAEQINTAYGPKYRCPHNH